MLLMGAAAVYGHKAFTPQTELSPIQLENAEAIANDESTLPVIPCVSADDKCLYLARDGKGELKFVEVQQAMNHY